MEKKSMDFQPWAWESENWGGDPEGPLAKALERARKQKPKPLKLVKLPHKNQKSLRDFEAQATHIDWETDGEEVDLPKTVEVPDDLDADEIADYLSDEYGFLVNAFQIKDAESYDAELEVFGADADRINYLETKAKNLYLKESGEEYIQAVCDAYDLDYHDKNDYLRACSKFIEQVDFIHVLDMLDSDDSDELKKLYKENNIDYYRQMGAESLEDYSPEELTTSNVNVGDFMVDAGKGSYGSEEGYMADWDNAPYSSWDDAWSDDVNFPIVEKEERVWLKNLTTIGVLAGAIYIGRKIKGV